MLREINADRLQIERDMRQRQKWKLLGVKEVLTVIYEMVIAGLKGINYSETNTETE